MFREHWGRAVAALVRATGDVDLAEDAAVEDQEVESPAVETETVAAEVPEGATAEAAVEAAAEPEAAAPDAADDDSWDAQIRAESDEAFRRTGNDVGTPIITYDPPTGNSLFGPVISSQPDDDTAVAFYDALRVFADFPAFSELKRSSRAPLDLPLFAAPADS